MGGSLAWLGGPLEFASAPLLAATTAAGTGLAAMSGWAGAVRPRLLGLALELVAAPGLLSTYAGAQLLASIALALGAVALAFPASMRHAEPVQSAAFAPQTAPPLRVVEPEASRQ